MRIRDVIFVAVIAFGLWFTFVPAEVAEKAGNPAFGTKETAETSTLNQPTPEMAAPAVAE
ncbi:MAG: hypothetical protein V7745_03755 [Pseudomonadales bacterium]